MLVLELLLRLPASARERLAEFEQGVGVFSIKASNVIAVAAERKLEQEEIGKLTTGLPKPTGLFVSQAGKSDPVLIPKES